MAPISHYATGAVAGVDALAPQGVALQVQRLGASRF